MSMREMLFKAKRKGSGEWVEGYYVKTKWYLTEGEMHTIIPTNSTFFPHCEMSEYFEVDESTLCQYTGLTDNNGNKIWEHDILHIGLRDFVIYYYPYFALYILADVKNGGGANGMTLQISEGEVIGNIFDNLELLKGGWLEHE